MYFSLNVHTDFHTMRNSGMETCLTLIFLSCIILPICFESESDISKSVPTTEVHKSRAPGWPGD